MAVAFDTAAGGYTRTTVSDGSSNTTLTINVPANVANGDLMIAVLHCSSILNPNSVTPPGDWTQIASNFGVNGNFALHTWVGWRIAASEPASYQWTIGSAGGDDHGWIFRVTGHDAASPIDVAGSFTSDGVLNPVAPSITTASANALAVWICGGKNGSNLAADDTSVKPTAATQVVYKKSRTNSNGVGSCIAYELRASAGATGTRTFSGLYPSSASYSSAIGFAIKEAITGLTITSVDTDNAVLAGQSQATFAGTGLALTAKFAVKRGSAIAYATDISLSGSTGGSFTAPTMTAMFSAGVRFGDVAFYAAETSGTAIASISGSITTATNWKYVNVTDLSATGSMGSLFYGNAVSLSDQVAYSSVTTRFRWPVTVSGDGYFTVNSSGSQAGDEFAYRIWDETDSTWGTEGTIEVNGGISSAEQVYAAGSLVQASLESSTLEGATLQ